MRRAVRFTRFFAVLLAVSGCALEVESEASGADRVALRPAALRGGGGSRPSGDADGAVSIGLGSDAFQVEQIEFVDDGGMSAWGALSVDPVAAARQAGASAGFVSVRTALGWVVHNLPVQSRPEADWPERVVRQGLPAPTLVPPVRTHFDLGSASPLRALDMVVVFTSVPLNDARELRKWEKAPLAPIVVQATQVIEPKGIAAPPPDGLPPQPPPPPPVLAPEPIDPKLGLANSWHTVSQPAQDNVQSAWNQCAPVAYANALAYLRSTFGLDVPHEHVRGINGNGLVGTIDLLSQRPVAGPCNGSPIAYCVDNSNQGGMFDGLYAYLDLVGLQDAVTLDHQGPIGDLPQVCADTITQGGPVSTAQGNAVTFAWIRSHIDDGDAVVLAYDRLQNGPNGESVQSGHALRIYGYSQVNGQDYLMALDDQQQDGLVDNQCQLQNGGLTWEIWAVGDSDDDGTLNKGLNDLREIKFAMAIGVN
jgi:hypothetical protein